MNYFARRIAVITVFALLAAGSFAAAYALRFGGALPAAYYAPMSVMMLCAVAVKLFSFCWHRLDRGVSRYIGFHDLLTLAKATTWSTIGLTFVNTVLLPGINTPRGVLLIDWGTTLLVFGLVRSAPRAVRDLRRHLHGDTARRVLIIGANDQGESLLRSLTLDRKQPYKAIGFLDSKASRQGRRIGGVPIVGTPDELPRLAATHAIDEVFVTGSLPGGAVRSVMADAESLGLPVRVLPTHEQLLRGSVSLGPRDVSIEDLLRRDPVRLDDQAIAEQIADKVVLVTGSSGSIGSEICRQLLKHKPARLVALDRSETGQFFLE